MYHMGEYLGDYLLLYYYWDNIVHVKIKIVYKPVDQYE